MDLAKDKEQLEMDPAEYLFTNTKYHDCHLTVGDPATDQVETIGVLRAVLASQSSVFREMLEKSELADPTGKHTHITDVSPPVFRLMLRYMYRGYLPRMNQETVAQLVICADKYNVQSLVIEASSLLKSNTVEEVFPALHCVAYLTLPDLRLRVSAIVQQHTDKLVNRQEFLELDDNCLEFITKQEKLAITEVELFKNLVCWAKQETEDDSNLRKKLLKPLRHIRFLTFSQDEIVREVIPTNILNPTEIVDLLSAITSNQSLASPFLCKIKDKRKCDISINSISVPFPSVENIGLFKSEEYQGGVGQLIEHSTKQQSDFTIKTCRNNVKLQSFKFRSRPRASENNEPFYTFNCVITAHEVDNGLEMSVQEVKFKGRVLCDEDVVIPLKLNTAQYLYLRANSFYKILIAFTSVHQAYDAVNPSTYLCFTNEERTCSNNIITVKFNGYTHVMQIEYQW